MELEQELSDEQGQQFTRNYNALELPSIVSSVVEYLHPLLTPYEIAVYWYLFNKSIVKTGDQYARTSTRGMSAIAKSGSGKSDGLSYGAIKKTIDALKDKEVVLIAGDTNRVGTLYRIAIPDEIPLCKKFMQESIAEEIAAIDTGKELDFYNVAEKQAQTV